MFHSHESLDENTFGDERIKRETKVSRSSNVPLSVASWIPSFIKKNVVIDETDYVQVGQTAETQFY